MRLGIPCALVYLLILPEVSLTAHMTIPIRDVNPGARTFGVVLYGRIFANQRTAGVGDYRGFVNLVLD